MILGNIKLIVKRLRQAMAIVEEGDTASQSIAKDKYVMWKGTLCKTDSAITQGGTLATSGAGKNLTAKTEGLGGEIATLNSNLTYTVAERKIGTYCGLDLYRQVFRIGAYADNTAYAVLSTLPSNAYLTNLYGICVQSDGSRVAANHYYDTTSYSALWQGANNAIYFRGHPNGSSGRFAVEYTKGTPA